MSAIPLYYAGHGPAEVMPTYASQAPGAENKRHVTLIPFKYNAQLVPFKTMARNVI